MKFAGENSFLISAQAFNLSDPTMDYFFCPPDKITKDSVLIDGEEFSHLVHVMRKRDGDTIRVVDGRGTAYEVILKELKKKQAAGKILAAYPNHNEPRVKLTLAAGILKNPSRFDFLVEKTTELGVCEIIPLKTERTIPAHAKTDRWQKLALAAMKQCGRGYLPHVRELTSLDDLLENSGKYDLRLVGHEETEFTASLQSHFAISHKTVLVLVGPEGGFSEQEIEMCLAKGCAVFSLGERRLRSETAAVAAASLILAQPG